MVLREKESSSSIRTPILPPTTANDRGGERPDGTVLEFLESFEDHHHAAVHMAAHAEACLRLGLPFSAVKVRGYWGRFYAPQLRPSRHLLAQAIHSVLAGPVAESRWRCCDVLELQSLDLSDRARTGNDLALARRLCRLLATETLETWLDHCRHEVDRHWPRIEALAEALLVQDLLLEKEASDVLEGVEPSTTTCSSYG